MIPLRSDSATVDDTDWGFILNDELMAGLRGMVEREAYEWDLSVEDALQEVYLWLSVRPKYRPEQGMAVWKVVNAARRRVTTLGETAVRRRANEVPLEDES